MKLRNLKEIQELGAYFGILLRDANEKEARHLEQYIEILAWVCQHEAGEPVAKMLKSFRKAGVQ